VSAEDAVLPSDWKHPHPFHRELMDGEEVDEKSEGPEFGIGRIRSRVPEMESDGSSLLNSQQGHECQSWLHVH
jgi:hypothetical protein